MHRIVLALAATVACGGAPPSAPPATLGPAAVGNAGEIEAIEVLGDEIERVEAETRVEPGACHRREPPLARVRCAPARAICSRARQICDRAGRLGDHPWADGRCRDARGSCERARCHCARLATPWEG